MKLNDFITKYLGQKVDYDNKFGAQCVDLFRQYCNDVLEIPHTGGVEGAKDLYLKYSSLPNEVKYFERVARGPLAGDVAIWDATSSNIYGHVAIVVGNMAGKDLLVLEQNGFTQEGTVLKIRTVDNLLGYLRRRTT